MVWNAILLAAATGTGSQTTPALPGGIIAWIICNSRKRHAVGGWLLFYYWQLYTGLIMSAVFFAISIESYVPENFDNGTRFALFLASAVPGLVLIVVQTIVATISLGVQTPDMFKLLRGILVAEVVVETVVLAIEAKYFPDNAILSILMLVQEALWLAYFLRSKRLQHVFNSQDWDIAVNFMYPPKLKVAT